MTAVVLFAPVAQADDMSSAPHRVVVHGHDQVVRQLVALARERRLAQVYLFTGPPGIGKETVARLLAQALLCRAEEPADRPCGVCRACRLVLRGAHPDTHFLAGPLRIDAVRDLQHLLALAPGDGACRVAVIGDLDQATAGAANCLLKTLEEPPRHAVVFLTAAEIAGVLPTVRSRCQVLSLRPLPVDEVQRVLESDWSAAPEQAELIARLSGGRLGWAVRAAGDPSVLSQRDTWLESLTRALGAGRAERIRIAGELARDSDALPDALAQWISWWRDVLLLHHGARSSVANCDRLAALEAAASRYGVAPVLGVLVGLQDALARLAASTNPQLTMEVLLLELPT